MADWALVSDYVFPSSPTNISHEVSGRCAAGDETRVPETYVRANG